VKTFTQTKQISKKTTQNQEQEEKKKRKEKKYGNPNRQNMVSSSRHARLHESSLLARDSVSGAL